MNYIGYLLELNWRNDKFTQHRIAVLTWEWNIVIYDYGVNLRKEYLKHL